MAGGDPDDPFEGISFDETFVQDASVREPSADDRAARLARIDRDHRALDAEREIQRKAARKDNRTYARKRRGHQRTIGLVIIGVVVGLIGWTTYQSIMEDGTGTAVAWKDDTGVHLAPAESIFPPAPDDQQDDPIGVPRPVPGGTGPYKFILTQSDSDKPAAFDPCQPIHVVVNHRTEPAGAQGLLDEAITMVRDATGLRFVIDGDTDEVPGVDRPAVDDERYPDRWSPVLVAWTDPEETPSVAGDIAGTAGPVGVTTDGNTVLVSGQVNLDGPYFRSLLGSGGAEHRAIARAVIAHELGHLVGLDHVDDPTQLMYSEGSDVTVFGVGDLLGLEQLGQGKCFSNI